MKVSFWTGHPKNDLRTQNNYCAVQIRDNGQWREITGDHDFNTQYYWERKNFFGTSLAHCQWQIPLDAKKGKYRIVHHAATRSLIGVILSFEGKSSEFFVE